jgi:hypothetical protein
MQSETSFGKPMFMQKPYNLTLNDPNPQPFQNHSMSLQLAYMQSETNFEKTMILQNFKINSNHTMSLQLAYMKSKTSFEKPVSMQSFKINIK